MKILFIHNTIPAYRLPFFERLVMKEDITLLLTNLDLNKRIYGNENDFGKLKQDKIITFKSSKKGCFSMQIEKILNKKKFDAIVLPPLDSLIELQVAQIVIKLVNISEDSTKLIYFWEKWEPPKDRIPVRKKLKNKVQRYFAIRVFNHIDYFIAAGTKAKENFLSYGIDNSKISVAYDASRVECLYEKNNFNIRDKYNIPCDSTLLMYYGRLIERKGIRILLDAIGKLKDQNIYLLICGDGDYAETSKRISHELGLNSTIFAGAIDPKDRGVYFSQCDIFVLPSYFAGGVPEAWGMTVNEAMQFSKPVIATTAVGSAHDLIIQRKNGIIIRENDPIALKDAIINVRDNLSDFCYEAQRLSNRVTYETMVSGFCEVFERIRLSKLL